ncbi:MAG: hypothetical protein EOP54_14070 [Sphingobacteriales bacterium]|nr:MAG: hypothetical protein EOP54_14070 [Sphingobacteriales bacterium]
MIRSLSIITLLLFAAGEGHTQNINVQARPLYVPFEVDGTYGLTDTFGNEFVQPGTYYFIENAGNFNYYIIGEQKKGAKDRNLSYWFMNPQTGKKLELGELKDNDPAFFKEDTAFYHFHRAGKSVLASPLVASTYTFDRTYDEVKGIKLYDTAGNNFKQIFTATLPGYDKEIWLLNDNQLSKVTQIKAEYKIEPIRSFSEHGYTRTSFAVGLAVRTPKAAPKPPPAKKVPTPVKTKKGLIPPPVMPAPPPPVPVSPDVNETDFYANIYNHELQLLGKGVTDKATLSKLFGKPATLGSQSESYVSAGSGIIKQTGDDYSTSLNDTYAIKRITKAKGSYGTQAYYFVKNEGNGKITEIASLENTNPYWAFFNNKKLLKLYFHKASRLSAYFDYDGVAMPKARLMIPAKYYDAQQDEAFIPFLIQ